MGDDAGVANYKRVLPPLALAVVVIVCGCVRVVRCADILCVKCI